MSQHYSDPTRESETYALPDVETFYAASGELWDAESNPSGFPDDGPNESGWYYWFCFPGCMPDSSPFGPFETRALALADAQRGE